MAEGNEKLVDDSAENSQSGKGFHQIQDDYYATPQESYYEEYEPHYIVGNRDSIPSNTNIVRKVFSSGSISYQCFDPNNFGQVMSTPQINYNEEQQQANHNRGVVQNPKNWDYIATARIVIPSYNEWGVDSTESNYYNKPWESLASFIGGDKMNKVSAADVTAGFFFLAVAKLFGPFAYFFAFWG